MNVTWDTLSDESDRADFDGGDRSKSEIQFNHSTGAIAYKLV
jgi:hypothetical protein